LNCRKATGSTALANIIVAAQNVSVKDPHGYFKTYWDGETGSGDLLPRSFCSNCGSTLGGWPSDPKGKISVALGVFPRMPTPEFELFSAHRQEWLGPVVPRERQYEFREGLEKHVKDD